MNTPRLFILLLILIGFMSCEKTVINGKDKLDVEKYIALLKSNQYDSLYLPAFTYKDIPALLKYRNETQVISNFPHNPISSMYGPDCKLGMYVLWTIESIRAKAIKSPNVIMGFPSQNPILGQRDALGSGFIYFDYDDNTQTIAARAYNEWWENNKQKDFDAFKNIDPLATTVYQWH